MTSPGEQEEEGGPHCLGWVVHWLGCFRTKTNRVGVVTCSNTGSGGQDAFVQKQEKGVSRRRCSLQDGLELVVTSRSTEMPIVVDT